MKQLARIGRTVRHLQARQVVYQLVNRLRRPHRLRLLPGAPRVYHLAALPPDKPVSLLSDGTFCLLNQPATRPHGWNDDRYGKLWTYTLNYFDCLNQPGLPVEIGLALMRNFMAHTTRHSVGMEPYPISLRAINWIRFLSLHRLTDAPVEAHLWAQLLVLSRRPEYHLAGNHLLENGFALLVGGLFFQHRRWFEQGRRLVVDELNQQMLADGGHDERSPMYHQLLLDRLLDTLALLAPNRWAIDPALVATLRSTAGRMLGWLRQITFADGSIPLVNDAAPGLAPDTAALLAKATRLGIASTPTPLSDSGYRMLRRPRVELLADVGPVGPDHQPGHAHADTLSFIVYVDKSPLFVDNATSTYTIGPRRTWERSTAAHNTVAVDGQDSSEVWAGFRVGRRARVRLLVDTENCLVARHNGYRQLGITHERAWQLSDTAITIHDRLLTTGNAPAEGIARFYIHPDQPVRQQASGLQIGPVWLRFDAPAPLQLRLVSVELADGFNRLRPATCLEVTFRGEVTTLLSL